MITKYQFTVDPTLPLQSQYPEGLKQWRGVSIQTQAIDQNNEEAGFITIGVGQYLGDTENLPEGVKVYTPIVDESETDEMTSE